MGSIEVTPLLVSLSTGFLIRVSPGFEEIIR